MPDAARHYPTVMVFAGLDPTGGAGLQADIEAIACQGAHALPVLTAVTVQDTHDVQACRPIDAFEVIEQARAVLEDVPVDAFKIGLLGSREIAEAVHTLLRDHPGVPVVLDPICTSGAGTTLADDDLIDAMITLLLPLTTVLTPNSLEARRLAPEADSVPAAAHALLGHDCAYVLATGGHVPGATIEHRLYAGHDLLETFSGQRFAGEYHGSGCTLAAAIAAWLAQGHEPVAAVRSALRYCERAIGSGFPIGSGQLIPDRLHRLRRGTP